MREYLTYKEKCLLLSALRREESVCENIDRKARAKGYSSEKDVTPIVQDVIDKFYYNKVFRQIHKDAIDDFTNRLRDELNVIWNDEVKIPFNESTIGEIIENIADKLKNE